MDYVRPLLRPSLLSLQLEVLLRLGPLQRRPSEIRDRLGTGTGAATWEPSGGDVWRVRVSWPQIRSDVSLPELEELISAATGAVALTTVGFTAAAVPAIGELSCGGGTIDVDRHGRPTQFRIEDRRDADLSAIRAGFPGWVLRFGGWISGPDDEVVRIEAVRDPG